MDIELSALDLHYLNVDYETVKLLDEIRVISKPHGMDRYFPVTKLEIPLDQPEDTQFTLGDTVRTTLTSASNKTNSEILRKIETLPKASTILEEAKANATSIMNMATNGYITITQDTNGTNTLYVSNNRDYTKATKLWKWNLNGLGYSKDGGKTYGLAITMNGAIVADYITTGTLNADLIKAGKLQDTNSNVVFDLSTGTLTMKKGSINIGSGKFTVSTSGYLTCTYGKIGGFTIGTSSIYNDILSLQSNGLKLNLDSVNVGTLGTNNMSGHDDQRGLVMDLEYEGHFLTWSARRSSNANTYTMKLTYINQSTAGFDYTNRLYLGCNLDGNGYRAYNLYIDPDTGGAYGGITKSMTFVQIISMNSDGTIGSWSNGCTMNFKHGLLVGARWYGS